MLIQMGSPADKSSYRHEPRQWISCSKANTRTATHDALHTRFRKDGTRYYPIDPTLLGVDSKLYLKTRRTAKLKPEGCCLNLIIQFLNDLIRGRNKIKFCDNECVDKRLDLDCADAVVRLSLSPRSIRGLIA
jgi:hypothetical protein